MGGEGMGRKGLYSAPIFLSNRRLWVLCICSCRWHRGRSFVF